MRIFVTGLCLQGNKGGPALALSMIRAIRKYSENAEFVFAVPPAPEYYFEQLWAKKYGLTVVEDCWDGDLGSLNPYRLLREGLAGFRRRFRRLWAFYSTMRACDLVLDMTAISYVGPPEGSEGHVMGTRHRYFRSASLVKRTFRAWTQSYGPFSTERIRRAARRDLSSLPIVYCRGEETRRQVQSLLPGKECRVFPDMAVILEFDRELGRRLMVRYFGEMPQRPVVTLSPSAVVYAKCGTAADGTNFHVSCCAQIADQLVERGFAVLIVPHTYRPAQHVPELCDFAVGLRVLASVKRAEWVRIVPEDLSPAELKSVISGAYIHIGARYHSVVAALSSGIPAISLSWHFKYGDIMAMYGLEGCVIDAEKREAANSVLAVFDQLSEMRDSVVSRLKECQPPLEAAVYENGRSLMDGVVVK